MKTLVIGAGSIGGYFGARMLQAKRDVTFLVREARAKRLKEHGLMVKSVAGDFTIAEPPVVTAGNILAPYDLIILTCKAYDLAGAIADFAPAVGPKTRIIPLLNGMSHLDALDQRFGAEHVLGGLCAISTTLDGEGRIHHMSPFQSLTFGLRQKDSDGIFEEVKATLGNAGFDAMPSDKIMQEMWEKWLFIAALGSATGLMRATVGDIIAAGAKHISSGLFAECSAIAAENGFPPSAAAAERGLTVMTTEGSLLTASMMRDIENKNPIEADHIVGDLLKRGSDNEARRPLLLTAYAHLKSYEARRARELATKKS
jgi:2-dehydropantoate 2-reductase